MASFSNSTPGRVISGTEAYDYITNNASAASIDAGAGNDYIYNYGQSSVIDAGSNSDYISNNARYATIKAGTGSDTVYNGYSGNNSVIDLGEGDDSIYSPGENGSTIDGGEGYDTISGFYSNTSINGGKGEDRISMGGGGDGNTISGGEGNDTIYADAINNGSALIQYSEGDGNDLIIGFNPGSTLQVVSGNIDSVGTDNENVFIVVGESTITLKGAYGVFALNVIDQNGNKYEMNAYETGNFQRTISGSDGVDNITLNPSYNNHQYSRVITKGGNDNVNSTWNSSRYNYFDLGDDNDYIGNNGPYSTILGGKGNDRIYTCYNTTQDSIVGGDGDDTISSGGPRSTIYGGDGDDSINSYGNGSVIDSGKGNDYVIAQAVNLSIKTGEGDDTVKTYSSNNTISTGAGNDSINDSVGNNNVIDGGEGNDVVIVGQGSTVKVGEGNDTINVGSSTTRFAVQDFNAGDVIVLARAVGDLSTTAGGVVADNVTISGLNGTINAETWTFNNGVANYVSIRSSDAVLLGDGRTIVYGQGREEDRKVLFTVNGVTSTDGLAIDKANNIVTVSATSLSQNSTVTISEGYNLALGSDVPGPQPYESEGWRFNNNTATYKDGSTTEGFVLSNNQISYQSRGGGNTLVTVNGVVSTDGLAINKSSKRVTVSLASLSKEEVVTVSDGYTLALGNDIPAPISVNGKGWAFDETEKTATYVNGTSTEQYKLENNQIFYDVQGTSEDVVTVYGITSTAGLTIDEENQVVTVSESSLSQDSVVSISEGYTLALNAAGPETEEPVWDYTGENAIARIRTSKGGYKLEDNKIMYVPEGTDETVVVFGVNGDSILDEKNPDITIEGRVVTLTDKALNGKEGPIRVSSGYTLALADDVSQPISSDKSWTFQDNTAIYTGTSRAAGYELVNNEVYYVSPITSREQVSIAGVLSTDGIVRDGNTFVISSKALDTLLAKDDLVYFAGGVDGYTFKLADDVKQPVRTSSKGWRIDGTNAIYSDKGTVTGGYILRDDDQQITYQVESKGDDVVTVSGVKSANGLWLTDTDDEKVVTVYEDALNETDIEISGGKYILELSDEDLNPRTTEGWTLENGRAAYSTGGKTAGYALDSDAKRIAYSTAVAGEEKVVLEGITARPRFTEDDPGTGIIELTQENIEGDASIISNDGEYQFEIQDGEYSNVTFTGNDDANSITNYGQDIVINTGNGVNKVENYGSTVTILGGEGNDRIINEGLGVSINSGKGNDNVSLNAEDTVTASDNVFVYRTGDGKDNITNFAIDDKIKIADSETPEIKAVVQNYDVIFKIGEGSITLKKAAEQKREIIIVGADDASIASISGNTYSREGVVSDVTGLGRKIVLAQTFSGMYTASREINETGDVNIVDGSDLTRGVSINGGTDGQSLFGGAGKDTLITGNHDNFDLRGGKGNDVFAYNGGTGVIEDYSQKGTNGKDAIVINGALSFSGYSTEGNNVVLNYGNGNTLTLEGALDANITFGTRNSTVNTYKKVGIFSGNGKSVTVEANQVRFSATNENSKVENIDGGLVATGIELIGNKKANYIAAGSAGATINGGKGKDTLVGNDGNDVFVYELKSGNKLIKNYDSVGDKISLLGGAAISEVKTSGSDLELKIGSNKVTIENGAGNSFTFIDGDDENATDQTFSNGFLVSGSNATVTSSYTAGTINVADSYRNINASRVKKNFTINGDGTDNFLVGSKGNDTINGGEGSDSLWGGKGNDLLIGTDESKDTFIFYAGDGTDTIRGYDNSLDELRIYDKRGRQEVSYSNSSFNNNTGTLTLSVKGGGKLLLEGMSAGGYVNVNGTSHRIIGKKLV